jgi:hypothetical protein
MTFGLRLSSEGDVAAAARRLGIPFRRIAGRPTDLAVRFHLRALPRGPHEVASISGVGFRVHPASGSLDCLVPKAGARQARRLRFLRTLACAHPLVQGARGSVPRRYFLRLHASGILGPRGALIFCGYSTYGKSTIAGLLSRRYARFGDDVVVLLCERTSRRGKPRIRAIFFERYAGAKSGRPGKRTHGPWALPVAGVFWLRKGRTCGLKRMGGAQALASILPPIARTPWGTAHKIAWLKCLLEETPCRELRFAKDREGLVRFLRKEGYL